MAAGVEPQDLQLGLHPLLPVELGQPADLAGVQRLGRGVPEVEGQLHRADGLGAAAARDWDRAAAHTPPRSVVSPRSRDASRLRGSLLLRAAASSSRTSAVVRARGPPDHPSARLARVTRPALRPARWVARA